MKNLIFQRGFTLIELAVVLVIVGVLLGVTLSLLPTQRDVRNYHKASEQIDELIQKIYLFAQINGRLPCPAAADTAGAEGFNLDVADVDLDGNTNEILDCAQDHGFIPVSTLSIIGEVNQDTLLLDPYGNPYRYYVTDSDTSVAGVANMWDFFNPAEMRSIGLGNADAAAGDGFLDLDGKIVICNGNSSDDDNCAGGGLPFIFGTSPDGTGEADNAGAPFLILSLGKNGGQQPAAGTVEEENWGNATVTLTGGPSGLTYGFASNPVFARPSIGASDSFDDIVKWGTTSELISKMIEAGKFP